MTISDILDRAAERLSKPGAWTQGELARDASGGRVSPTAGGAVCWCVVGAIRAEARSGEVQGDPISFAEQGIRRARRDHLRPLARWNDRKSRTQPEVVAKLRKAAAKAREQGK